MGPPREAAQGQGAAPAIDAGQSCSQPRGKHPRGGAGCRGRRASAQAQRAYGGAGGAGALQRQRGGREHRHDCDIEGAVDGGVPAEGAVPLRQQRPAAAGWMDGWMGWVGGRERRPTQGPPKAASSRSVSTARRTPGCLALWELTASSGCCARAIQRAHCLHGTATTGGLTHVVQAAGHTRRGHRDGGDGHSLHALCPHPRGALLRCCPAELLSFSR